MKNIYSILLLSVCLIFTGCRTTSYLETEGVEPEVSISDLDVEEEVSTSCFVQVSGAVNNPGVYELYEGARVYEAIEMAGGLCEDAYSENLNQATKVTDGQMIHILTTSQWEESRAGEAESDGKVNINTADAKMLMTLPGIGESKATSIIAFREENGLFQTIEDLMKITGIKEGVYNKIKGSITVGY